MGRYGSSDGGDAALSRGAIHIAAWQQSTQVSVSFLFSAALVGARVEVCWYGIMSLRHRPYKGQLRAAVAVLVSQCWRCG